MFELVAFTLMYDAATIISANPATILRRVGPKSTPATHTEAATGAPTNAPNRQATNQQNNLAGRDHLLAI